jgi:hypothetical protein
MSPSRNGCPGSWPSAARSPTHGSTGSRTGTGTATGSAPTGCGATSSPTTGALTARSLLRLPGALRTADTDRLADAILRANAANYREDGSATCAFVMPSTIDGRAAHTADPLANDQDWHLVLWLQARDRARAEQASRVSPAGPAPS